LLISVSEGVPDIDDVIFTSREDNWNIWMESNSGDVVLVTIIECKQALLGLIIPHFDLSIITS